MVIHSPVDGHLHILYFLSIMNNTAVNTYLYIFVKMCF